MKHPLGIKIKLQTSAPEIKRYIEELVKENSRLHSQIAKLRVKTISQQNEIASLKKAQPKMVVKVTNFGKKDKKV